MHSESNHMEESLSRHSTGPGETHLSDSNLNVAPASDVISLSFKYSSLRRSIRHVNAAATEPLTEDAHDAGMHSDKITW